MKFTLSWLKEHLDTIATADGIAERLTMIGLEVESVEDPSKAFAPFRIARVVSAVVARGAGSLAAAAGVDVHAADPGRATHRRVKNFQRRHAFLSPWILFGKQPRRR